jgi:hypothetical protein
MARINGDLPFVFSQHGSYKKGKKGDTRIVTRTVYGNTYANPVTYSLKEPTAAQLAVQSRFAEASDKASKDMLDPEKKAEWKAVADASNGKWKTARGAAFASYYAAGADFD